MKSIKHENNNTVSAPEEHNKSANQGFILRYHTILRILASLALLWFIMRKIPLAEIFKLFGQITNQWPFLIIALVIPGFGILLGTIRWQILLKAQGNRVSVIELYKANLVGAFYNQIFPSTIGGDVARSIWANKIKISQKNTPAKTESAIVSFTVVGVDRFIGSIGIIVMGLIAAGASPSIVMNSPEIMITLYGITVGIILIVLLAFFPARTAGRFIFSISLLTKLRDKAVMVYHALKAYKSQKHSIFIAFLLSLGIQMTIIAQYWTLSNALGLNVSLWGLSVVIPIVTLISMVPITISGIGLRENALYVLGGTLGFNAGNAVALAWAFLAPKLFWALLGGLLQVKTHRKKSI